MLCANFLKFSVAAVLFASTVCNALAQQVPRQAHIDHIIQVHLNALRIETESEIIQQEISLGKVLNPATSVQEWDVIAKELSSALFVAMTGEGSQSYGNMQAALTSFTDAELDELDHLVSQRVYRRFVLAQYTVPSKELLYKALIIQTERQKKAVEGVFGKYGLKR